MYKFYYPQKDAWISESSGSSNFGHDQILEIGREYNIDNDLTGVSRTLIHFDMTSISTDIASPSPIGLSANTKYFLKMYSSEATALADAYTLKANAVSQSWVEGTGKFIDKPAVTNGTSWLYGNAEYSSSFWTNLNADATSGSRPSSGGSMYYTGSGFEASQSFSYESPDVEMDVTHIVKKWLASSIDNNGLVVRFEKEPTSTTDDSEGTNLKFFSRNTHTIYFPRLVAKDVDAVYPDLSTVGGAIELDISGSISNYVYVKQIKPSYKEAETVRFRVGCRPQFVNKSFSTTVQSYTGSYIPETSGSYSIQDLSTGETMIPFGSYSLLNCDVNGNYFTQDLNTFQLNRFYKILIKVTQMDGTEIIYDDDSFEFKVVQ